MYESLDSHSSEPPHEYNQDQILLVNQGWV